MNKFIKAVKRIRRARKMKKQLTRGSKLWNGSLTGYQELPEGFVPARDGGKELDEINSDIVEVLPTYYEYNEKGRPTGRKNGEDS